MVTKVKEKKTATKKIKKAVKKKKEISVKKIKDKPAKKVVKEEKIKKDYISSLGRRKSAIARVRFYKKGNGEIIINGKDIKKFFPYFEYQKTVKEPLKFSDKLNNGKITIKVIGGGMRGQAESIRLGISKLLIEIDKNLRPILRTNELLTRDPRVKERKKYGLRKARRAPQWQKR